MLTEIIRKAFCICLHTINISYYYHDYHFGSSGIPLFGTGISFQIPTTNNYLSLMTLQKLLIPLETKGTVRRVPSPELQAHFLV